MDLKILVPLILTNLGLVYKIYDSERNRRDRNAKINQQLLLFLLHQLYAKIMERDFITKDDHETFFALYTLYKDEGGNGHAEDMKCHISHLPIKEK